MTSNNFKYLTHYLTNGFEITEPKLQDTRIACAEMQQRLKVPKCEIFDRSDFPDFYTIKSPWVGDLVVKY
jgi:hypothetical protein